LERRLRDQVELERLRKQTEDDLAQLKVARAWLREHFERPAPDDIDGDWFAKSAERAQKRRREAEAHFPPVIAALKDALEPPNGEFEAEVQQLLRDGIKVLEGWLAFYDGFHTMLARQAAVQETRQKTMRARLVEGEVDHEVLTREIIERFPKILAALAE
jgi:hypothetical protein